MNKRRRKMIDDPAMSDKILLLTVEDLIYTAFGSNKGNRVDFKLLQSIFLILARELRLLQQNVEIKFDDIIELAREKKAGYDDSYDDESGTYSSSSVGREEDEGGAERADKKGRVNKGDKTKRGGKSKKVEKGEKEERKGRRGKGEKENGKTSSKDRDDKGRSKGRDKRSRDTDTRSRGRRGEDERGEERGADRPGEWDGKRGPDGRRERGGEREDRDAKRLDRGGFERKDFGRQTSGTSITVSEATRRGPGGRRSVDKILVAERGPAARVRPARIGSIEVVTASQFALLGKAVKQLEQITRPQPAPVLPDDKTLRQDLAQGRASLQDTMQAVQLNERVQAAEQGLYHLAELLTQRAQSGMLPPEFAVHVGEMEEYLQAAIAAGHAAAGPGGPGGPGGRGAHFDKRMELDASIGYGPGSIERTACTVSRVDPKKFTATVAAEAAEAQGTAGVTHNEMNEVMQHMKDGVLKEISNLTARANHSAEMAFNTSKIIADKMDIAMQVNERINALFRQTEEYDLQLSGFDTGMTIQVQSFQEQLVLMREDLAGGLALLDASNNNAETAALLDLTERHQVLVEELENTALQHKNLHITQHQISDEIRNLIQSFAMLREQKADCDEVLNGLKNKANLSCLDGLLNEKLFTQARSEIEKRLAKCYEKFTKNEVKWRDAMNEMLAIANNKAEILMLMLLKDATSTELNAIQKLLCKLEEMLGEPKAAIRMHKQAKDAACAACLTRALMEPEDPTYGKPLPLPALRPPPLGVELQPCLGQVNLAPPDIRDHTCRRWVGGSHTLMSSKIVKEQAEFMQLQMKPTKKFEGYGSDGRLYMMEEDMQPCAECNQLSTNEAALVSPHPPTPSGAGD